MAVGQIDVLGAGGGIGPARTEEIADGGEGMGADQDRALPEQSAVGQRLKHPEGRRVGDVHAAAAQHRGQVLDATLIGLDRLTLALETFDQALRRFVIGPDVDLPHALAHVAILEVPVASALQGLGREPAGQVGERALALEGQELVEELGVEAGDGGVVAIHGHGGDKRHI